MLVVKVEHFVKEGHRDLYIELIDELCVKITAFNASARRLVSITAPEENHLLLEFHTKDAFKKWHDSIDHTEIKNKLLAIFSQAPNNTKFKLA